VNGAILRKTWRDTWLLLLIAAVVIAFFELFFILAVTTKLTDIRVYLRNIPPFIQGMLRMLAGADILDHLTPTGVMSIGFSHPFVHIVLWFFSIAYCTRVIVGEIDSGVADLLMTLPVSRSRLYVTLSVVAVACKMMLNAAPWVGTWLTQTLFGYGPFELKRLAMVCVNLFTLYLAIGAGGLLISVTGSRRARAIGILAALLLASFVLNFLAAIWEPAQRIAFLGVLDYYQPLVTIASGEWPIRPMAVLLSVATVCWLAGLIHFRRRDILTG